MTSKPAPVKWAQRKDLVYLNIEVQDVQKPEIKVEEDKIIYRGTTKDNQVYESQLVLFDKIKPDESKWCNRDRGAEFVLIKTNPGSFWKRLLSSDVKYHWLKVDFNKWKDENDSENEDGGSTNFEEMMRQMGGLGGDMPGMNPNFDEEEDLPDSDDENIPTLEDGKDGVEKESSEEKKE